MSYNQYSGYGGNPYGQDNLDNRNNTMTSGGGGGYGASNPYGSSEQNPYGSNQSYGDTVSGLSPFLSAYLCLSLSLYLSFSFFNPFLLSLSVRVTRLAMWSLPPSLVLAHKQDGPRILTTTHIATPCASTDTPPAIKLLAGDPRLSL